MTESTEVEEARLAYVGWFLKGNQARNALRELQCLTPLNVTELSSSEAHEDFTDETLCGLPIGHAGEHSEDYAPSLHGPQNYVDAITVYQTTTLAREISYLVWRTAEDREQLVSGNRSEAEGGSSVSSVVPYVTECGAETCVEWRFLLMSLHCRRLDGRDLTTEMTAAFNEFWPATAEGEMQAVLNRIQMGGGR